MNNTTKEQIELLSIVIPAKDEEESIGSTIKHISVELEVHKISTVCIFFL
jgi:hypothetical protein